MAKNEVNNDHTKNNSKSKKEIKEQPILSPEITQYFIPTSFLGTKKPTRILL